MTRRLRFIWSKEVWRKRRVYPKVLPGSSEGTSWPARRHFLPPSARSRRGGYWEQTGQDVPSGEGGNGGGFSCVRAIHLIYSESHERTKIFPRAGGLVEVWGVVMTNISLASVLCTKVFREMKGEVGVILNSGAYSFGARPHSVPFLCCKPNNWSAT